MENCSQNDVEIVKQTMLKHEAIFREQVHELHRIYQVQRLLMAEQKRKDSAVLDHFVSPLPCSVASSFLFTAENSLKERNLWELDNGTSNDTKNGSKYFPYNLKQCSFSKSSLANRLTLCKVNSSAGSVNFCRKTEQRMLDLELPAENYMDTEVEGRDFQKELVLRMPSGISCNVPPMDRLEQQCDLQLTLCTGLLRENDKGYHTLTLESRSREPDKGTNFPVNSSNHMEIDFFPILPARDGSTSQHASLQPAQASTKSFFRTLGFDGKIRSDNLSISKWKKTNVDQQGRKDVKQQTSEFEAGPDSVHRTDSLIQSSSCHRAFPFLEMHNRIATSRMSLGPGETGMPTSFLGNSMSESARYNAPGTFLRKQLGEKAKETLPLTSCKDDANNQDSSGTYMHQPDIVLSSDLHELLPDSQLLSKTQTFYNSGINQTYDGSMHDSSRWLWNRQNRPSISAQVQKQSVHEPVSFHLAGHEALQNLAHISSVDMEQLSCPQGPLYQATISSHNKVPKKYENCPTPLISVPSVAENCLKMSSYMQFINRTEDTEPTPELQSSSRKDTENLFHSAKKIGCLSAQKSAGNNLQWNSIFMKDLDTPEAEMKGKHSMAFSSPLHISCSREFESKENGVPVQVQQKIACIEGATTTRASLLDQSLKATIAGHLQEEAVDCKMAGNEAGSTTVMGKELAIFKHIKQEESASEDQSHGNEGCKGVKYHNANQKEQADLQNNYTLPVHFPTSANAVSYLKPKESNCRVSFHLDYETEKKSAIETSFIRSEERQNETCQEQPGQIPIQSNLCSVFNEIKQVVGITGSHQEAYSTSVKTGSNNAEAPNITTSGTSQSNKLCAIENLETSVSMIYNNNQPESAEDVEVVDILLSLQANSFSDSDWITDNTTCTPVRSLGHMTNVIQSGRSEYLHASSSATLQSVCTYLKEAVMPEAEDDSRTSNQVSKPQKLDFLESVTCMLKASGIAMDEQNHQVVKQMEVSASPLTTMQKCRSLQRISVGNDVQKKMLPSIASLSQKEITKDLQIIEGLVRSVSNDITNRPSDMLYKNDISSEPTTQCSPKTTAGARGNVCISMKKAIKDEEGSQSFNGLPPVGSWGYATRRRRMRRHRSQLSILASGSAIVYKEAIR